MISQVPVVVDIDLTSNTDLTNWPKNPDCSVITSDPAGGGEGVFVVTMTEQVAEQRPLWKSRDERGTSVILDRTDVGSG